MLVADEGVGALVLRLDGELASAENSRRAADRGGGAANAVCLPARVRRAWGRSSSRARSPHGRRRGPDERGRLRKRLVGDPRAGTRRRRARRRAGRRRPSSVSRTGNRSSARDRSSRESSSGSSRAIRRHQGEGRRAPDATQGRAAHEQSGRSESVFKNPEHELTAGLMLEACGLKGDRSAAHRSPLGTRISSRTPAERSPPTAIALMAEARRRPTRSTESSSSRRCSSSARCAPRAPFVIGTHSVRPVTTACALRARPPPPPPPPPPPAPPAPSRLQRVVGRSPTIVEGGVRARVTR